MVDSRPFRWGRFCYRRTQVGVFKRVCRRCIQSVDFQYSAKVNIAVNKCLKKHSIKDYTLF
jgi:hypothetical protein